MSGLLWNQSQTFLESSLKRHNQKYLTYSFVLTPTYIYSCFITGHRKASATNTITLVLPIYLMPNLHQSHMHSHYIYILSWYRDMQKLSLDFASQWLIYEPIQLSSSVAMYKTEGRAHLNTLKHGECGGEKQNRMTATNML